MEQMFFQKMNMVTVQLILHKIKKYKNIYKQYKQKSKNKTNILYKIKTSKQQSLKTNKITTNNQLQQQTQNQKNNHFLKNYFLREKTNNKHKPQQTQTTTMMIICHYFKNYYHNTYTNIV